MARETWTFSSYLEEIFMLSEVAEVPGVAETRELLINEMWDKFPEECKAIGLKDRE